MSRFWNNHHQVVPSQKIGMPNSLNVHRSELTEGHKH